MQEAYHMPRSCSVSWSSDRQEGDQGVPHSVPTGGTPIQFQWGCPIQPQWGVPHPVLMVEGVPPSSPDRGGIPSSSDREYPIQSWWGVPHPVPMGYPRVPLSAGWGAPCQPDGGTPCQLDVVPPPSARWGTPHWPDGGTSVCWMGYPLVGWGTPCQPDRGTPHPEMWTDRHLWKQYIPSYFVRGR